MTNSLLGFGYLEKFSKKIFLFIGSFSFGGQLFMGLHVSSSLLEHYVHLSFSKYVNIFIML